MFKKRMLLLGAAVAAFGAMSVGAGFSFGTFMDSDTSTNVAVIDSADNATVVLTGHVPAIPANNLYYSVDNIEVLDVDANYQYNLTKLEVTSPGSVQTAACGTHDYQLSNGADIVTGAPILTVNNAQVDTGYDLQLKIATSGTTTTCVITGGVVTATFEATGF